MYANSSSPSLLPYATPFPFAPPQRLQIPVVHANPLTFVHPCLRKLPEGACYLPKRESPEDAAFFDRFDGINRTPSTSVVPTASHWVDKHGLVSPIVGTSFPLRPISIDRLQLIHCAIEHVCNHFSPLHNIQMVIEKFYSGTTAAYLACGVAPITNRQDRNITIFLSLLCAQVDEKILLNQIKDGCLFYLSQLLGFPTILPQDFLNGYISSVSIVSEGPSQWVQITIGQDSFLFVLSNSIPYTTTSRSLLVSVKNATIVSLGGNLEQASIDVCKKIIRRSPHELPLTRKGIFYPWDLLTSGSTFADSAFEEKLLSTYNAEHILFPAYLREYVLKHRPHSPISQMTLICNMALHGLFSGILSPPAVLALATSLEDIQQGLSKDAWDELQQENVLLVALVQCIIMIKSSDLPLHDHKTAIVELILSHFPTPLPEKGLFCAVTHGAPNDEVFLSIPSALVNVIDEVMIAKALDAKTLLEQWEEGLEEAKLILAKKHSLVSRWESLVSIWFGSLAGQLGIARSISAVDPLPTLASQWKKIYGELSKSPPRGIPPETIASLKVKVLWMEALCHSPVTPVVALEVLRLYGDLSMTPPLRSALATLYQYVPKKNRLTDNATLPSDHVNLGIFYGQYYALCLKSPKLSGIVESHLKYLSTHSPEVWQKALPDIITQLTLGGSDASRSLALKLWHTQKDFSSIPEGLIAFVYEEATSAKDKELLVNHLLQHPGHLGEKRSLLKSAGTPYGISLDSACALYDSLVKEQIASQEKKVLLATLVTTIISEGRPSETLLEWAARRLGASVDLSPSGCLKDQDHWISLFKGVSEKFKECDYWQIDIWESIFKTHPSSFFYRLCAAIDTKTPLQWLAFAAPQENFSYTLELIASGPRSPSRHYALLILWEYSKATSASDLWTVFHAYDARLSDYSYHVQNYLELTSKFIDLLPPPQNNAEAKSRCARSALVLVAQLIQGESEEGLAKALSCLADPRIRDLFIPTAAGKVAKGKKHRAAPIDLRKELVKTYQMVIARAQQRCSSTALLYLQQQLTTALCSPLLKDQYDSMESDLLALCRYTLKREDLSKELREACYKNISLMIERVNTSKQEPKQPLIDLIIDTGYQILPLLPRTPEYRKTLTGWMKALHGIKNSEALNTLMTAYRKSRLEKPEARLDRLFSRLEKYCIQPDASKEVVQDMLLILLGHFSLATPSHRAQHAVGLYSLLKSAQECGHLVLEDLSDDMITAYAQAATYMLANPFHVFIARDLVDQANRFSRETNAETHNALCTLYSEYLPVYLESIPLNNFYPLVQSGPLPISQSRYLVKEAKQSLNEHILFALSVSYNPQQKKYEIAPPDSFLRGIDMLEDFRNTDEIRWSQFGDKLTIMVIAMVESRSIVGCEAAFRILLSPFTAPMIKEKNWSFAIASSLSFLAKSEAYWEVIKKFLLTNERVRSEQLFFIYDGIIAILMNTTGDKPSLVFVECYKDLLSRAQQYGWSHFPRGAAIAQATMKRWGAALKDGTDLSFSLKLSQQLDKQQALLSELHTPVGIAKVSSATSSVGNIMSDSECNQLWSEFFIVTLGYLWDSTRDLPANQYCTPEIWWQEAIVALTTTGTDKGVSIATSLWTRGAQAKEKMPTVFLLEMTLAELLLHCYIEQTPSWAYDEAEHLAHSIYSTIFELDKEHLSIRPPSANLLKYCLQETSKRLLANTFHRAQAMEDIASFFPYLTNAQRISTVSYLKPFVTAILEGADLYNLCAVVKLCTSIPLPKFDKNKEYISKLLLTLFDRIIELDLTIFSDDPKYATTSAKVLSSLISGYISQKLVNADGLLIKILNYYHYSLPQIHSQSSIEEAVSLINLFNAKYHQPAHMTLLVNGLITFLLRNPHIPSLIATRVNSLLTGLAENNKLYRQFVVSNAINCIEAWVNWTNQSSTHAKGCLEGIDTAFLLAYKEEGLQSMPSKMKEACLSLALTHSNHSPVERIHKMAYCVLNLDPDLVESPSALDKAIITTLLQFPDAVASFSAHIVNGLHKKAVLQNNAEMIDQAITLMKALVNGGRLDPSTDHLLLDPSLAIHLNDRT